MTKTLALPHRELRCRTHGAPADDTQPAWDLYLDGTHIASGYASESEAQRELDLVAWYAVFGEATLSPAMPITDEALGLAMAVFNRWFSTLKIQEKARVALDQIIRAGIYTISTDGNLSVLASSSSGRAGARRAYAITALRTPADDDVANMDTYTVSMACECRDFWTRAHDHGGICKHVAARLLLFLAQRGVGYLKHLRDALDLPSHDVMGASSAAPAPTATDDGDAIAFLDIGAMDLLAALFLVARGDTPIALRVECGTLHLDAPPIALAFPGIDGGNSAAVRLETQAVAALYEQLRPIAKRLAVITIFVAPSDGSVVLCSHDETFSATAQGTTLPASTPALSQPDSALTHAPPRADSDIVEALYELFTLLEAHEPAWYQRRHSRIVHTALQSAGRIA